MSTFLDLMDGVTAYYGSGSDEWSLIGSTMMSGGVTPEIAGLLQQVPGVSITRSASGAILGYDYSNPFPVSASPAAIVDSNAGTGAYGLSSFNANLPATVVTDSGTGVATLQSGAVVQGTGSTLAAVADKVSLGVAGVALGTKLGLAIDRALYAAAPEFWDDTFPTLNPETWNTLVPEGAAGTMVRALLGIDNDTATMYLDERLVAYAYQAMLRGGAWGGAGSADYHGDTTGLYMENIVLPLHFASMGMARMNRNELLTYTTDAPKSAVLSYVSAGTGMRNFDMAAASLDSDFTLEVDWENGGDQTLTPAEYTVRGETFYVAGSTKWVYPSSFQPLTPYDEMAGSPDYTRAWGTLGYILLFGDINPGRPEGIEDNPNAGIQIDPSQVINPTTGEPVGPYDDLPDVIQGLRTAYPGLFGHPVYEDVPQDDGTVQRITYIPVPYPNTTTDGYPVTDLTPGVDPQVHPEVSPESRPDTGQDITDWIIDPPAPPDTGSGESPLPYIPAGSASALYSIYNPSSAELSSFGAWLWSTNFVDQLLKLFSDPMQAIIGLHKVYCTPPVSGRGNIKVGYLDSGVATNLVSGQYVTVPCGSVTLSEFFGNVLDYDPYTRIQIYLPFVGIVPLDTGDVMRGTLTVTYHIDVLTGACLAEVSVTRDAAGGILYTYTGNAAVQYPVSSGSYMGILSSLVSMAGGIAGTIASGGAMAPLAMGAASGILSARTRVQHSGGFAGNAGAMGARVPYLIITRPQSALAARFEDYQGIPANYTTQLGRCTGFVRVKAAHLEGLPATLPEIQELEEMLREGILI